MPKRIDLSFSAGPTSPPEYAQTPEASDDEDTFRAPDDQVGETTTAHLEHLHIGQHTVLDAVKGLEKVFGHELHASKLIPQGRDTIRILLEPGVKLSKSNMPYDITDGGEIHSRQVRDPGTTPRLDDHMIVKFRTKFDQAPSVMVGINYIDTSRSANVRVYGYPKEVQKHALHLHSQGWADTVIYGVGYTWLAVPSYDHPLFQVGTFYTSEDHRWDVRQQLTHRKITFSTPYESPPKVVVWLNYIDCHHEHNDRVVAYATDITAKDFIVHIDTWDNTHLCGGGIYWFAYPADTPGICSGSLQPSRDSAGLVTFDKPFAKPPRRILVALNKIDTNRCSNCRMKIVYEAVSEWGMGVRVETWNDSIIHAAGISYIAME